MGFEILGSLVPGLAWPGLLLTVVILFCLNSTLTNVVQVFTVTWHTAFPQMVIKIFLNEIGTEFHLIGRIFAPR